MTIDPDTAAASLLDIADTERRARESVFYSVSSSILILWGVLVASVQLFLYFQPQLDRSSWRFVAIWGAFYIAGMSGTYAILRTRARPRALSPLAWRLLGAMVILIAYGVLWTALLGPAGAKWFGVFWPTLFMFGFVLAGLWVGRFFVACGLVVTALVVAGYLWLEPWYPLWLAVVEGGALIVSGLWMRRIGMSR
jgi:hypothetical protein